MKKNEENKEEIDADKFWQQYFEPLKKYVEEKITVEGQFLRMTTNVNYHMPLQEPAKLQLKRDIPRNI